MSDIHEADVSVFRKWRKIVLVSLLLIIGIPTIVYAGYWIYSQNLPVTVSEYTITIEASTDGREVTLSGQLLDSDNEAVYNGTVRVWQTDSDGQIVGGKITDIQTDTSGRYSTIWMAPSNGTYYFKAGYFVPVG